MAKVATEVRPVEVAWLLKLCQNGDCHGDLFFFTEEGTWKCMMCSRQHYWEEGILKLVEPAKGRKETEVDEPLIEE